jgi:hypothetical protein
MPRQASIILYMQDRQSTIMQHYDLATDKDGDLPSKREKASGPS